MLGFRGQVRAWPERVAPATWRLSALKQKKPFPALVAGEARRMQESPSPTSPGIFCVKYITHRKQSGIHLTKNHLIITISKSGRSDESQVCSQEARSK